jgi:hypothetical protein
MPLPFDTTQIDQVQFNYPGVPVFGIPKYDSVTPAEELAIIPILKATAADLDQQSMVKCQQALATVALKRLYPDQSETDTGALPLALVKDLADFLLSERRGWEPVEEDEDAEKKLIGTATSPKSAPSSPNSTGDSAPDGPTASAGKASAKSRSRKSETPA